MGKLVALILTLALFAGACSLDTQAPIVEVVQSSGNETDVSESYLWEGIHRNWANHAGTLLNNVWYNCSNFRVDTTTWPDDNKIRLHFLGSPSVTVLEFTDLHYDSENTDIRYGTTKLGASFDKEIDGHSYLYDLTEEDEPGKFAQTDTISLEQQRSVSMSRTVEFDLTVTNALKIGGKYAGVSLEDTLTTTFGYKNTTEYSQAESESTAKSTSHTFDVDLSERAATLITVDTSEVHTSTPFYIDGIASWGLKLTIGQPCLKSYPTPLPDLQKTGTAAHDWTYGQSWIYHPENDVRHCWKNIPKPGKTEGPDLFAVKWTDCTITFTTFEDFSQMWTGTNVNWPGMHHRNQPLWEGCQYRGWIDCAASIDSKHVYYGPLRHIDARRVQLSGIQQRVYENATRTRVREVTGQNLNQVLKQHSAVLCDQNSSTCG